MRAALLIGLLGLAAIGCSVDWSRKDAWRHCGDAVEAWPGKAAPPCSALIMCANEAKLPYDQNLKLMQMIRATPGCQDP